MDDDLFENAACGLLQTRADGTITRVNAIFCDWIGATPDALVGTRLQDLLSAGGRLFYQTHWGPQMRQRGSVAEIKVDVIHRDGEPVPMLFNAVRRQRGDAVHIDVGAMVVRDRQKYERELIDARANAEAARLSLARTNDRKDEFLATLAHELRNPLAPLHNGVALLRLRLRPSADRELPRIVDIFDRQVQQLTRVVDELLEVSRLTHRRLTLRLERVDLRSALEDAIEAAQPAIAAARHTLHQDLPATPVWLEADGARLTQMVLNLLDNAARFTPPGGEVWLHAAQDGEAAVISVRDSGTGIPPENLAWIFEMFSQVNAVAQRPGGGLGIGLALVKGLAELHGGTIEVQSAGVGRGSLFTLRLPLQAATPPAGAAG